MRLLTSSESSLFVAPHLIILKTCGTTLNLLGLHRIIEIARHYCGFTNVWRCFYSRKSFFFPERQMGPHRDWRDEVDFLDTIFGTSQHGDPLPRSHDPSGLRDAELTSGASGSAYTVGPMNRDHWLLYLTTPNAQPLLPSDTALNNSSFRLSLPPPTTALPSAYQDTTLEILMSYLEPAGRLPFFHDNNIGQRTGHQLGDDLSSSLGIDQLFSPEETRLDSFGFEPCGYSANAVIGSGMPGVSATSGGAGGGYYTIHVTPEEGWSYASFECNVPLPSSTDSPGSPARPTLPALIRNVLKIFQPNRLSITLFVSTSADVTATSDMEQRAWSAFGTGILGKEYERKDRIGYEFDGYDLVFACFERKGWVEPKGQHGLGVNGKIMAI